MILKKWLIIIRRKEKITQSHRIKDLKDIFSIGLLNLESMQVKINKETQKFEFEQVKIDWFS